MVYVVLFRGVGWSVLVLLFERKFCHQAKSFANFPLPLLERRRSNQRYLLFITLTYTSQRLIPSLNSKESALDNTFSAVASIM